MAAILRTCVLRWNEAWVPSAPPPSREEEDKRAGGGGVASLFSHQGEDGTQRGTHPSLATLSLSRKKKTGNKYRFSLR